MVFNEKQAYNLLTLAAGAFLVSIAVLSPGTGDDGDSVQHFLFAEYAFQHPANFFNHWAKPIYVMLAAPFAQLGFIGVKVMNALLLTFQIFLLGKIARHFDLKNAWLLPIFSLVAPMNLTQTMSGLTEPLFAVWLVGPLLLLLRGQAGWAYFLWSFLPFVRSEGLVIFCPLVIFMALRGDWRWLPVLAVGHLALGLAGWPWHDGPGWVFTEIPYRNVSDSAYGSGSWTNFITNMPVIIGPILSGLLVIGMFRLRNLDPGLRGLRDGKFVNSNRKSANFNEFWLIYGFFSCFFMAHTIFWGLGIFNSFGLLRVFLGIMPCLLLICLNGANGLFSTIFLFLKNKNGQLAAKFALPLLAAFLTWKNLSWDFDFGLTSPQLASENAASAIRSDFPDLSKSVVYAEYPDVHRVLGVDFFTDNCRRAAELFDGSQVPENSIIVYEDGYMGGFCKNGVEALRQDPRFVRRGEFGTDGKRWDDRQYIHVFYAISPKNGTDGLLFENPLDTFGTELGGQKCLKLDEKYPFSPGFSGPVGSLKAGDNLILSFEICQPDTTDFAAVTRVFQLETGGKMLVYRNVDFKKELRAAGGKWKKFRFLEKMPAPKTPDDKLGIYLWNPNGKPVFLKNLEVRRL